MNQSNSLTQVPQKSAVTNDERLAPQFMNYQLVGGTISIMIWHADSAQRNIINGVSFPNTVQKMNNCDSYMDIDELLTDLKNVSCRFIAERIILSVGFQEGKKRQFILENFLKSFVTMIHVLRKKGCREMIVTNVPPCAVECLRIQHWMNLQTINAGIKKFCDRNDDLYFCNIFQLFCHPRNFERRNEYVINNIRNYDLNIKLYNVKSAPRLIYKNLAEIFSDEGKKVLLQHIEKTIECRTNQFTLPSITTLPETSKLKKHRPLVSKNHEHVSIEGAFKNDQFSEKSRFRLREVSRRAQLNTMDSKNHRLSTKNTSFKSGVLNNAGRQIGVKKLNRTTTSGEVRNRPESMISSVTKNFGGIHPKRSHVVNEKKSEITNQFKIPSITTLPGTSKLKNHPPLVLKNREHVSTEETFKKDRFSEKSRLRLTEVSRRVHQLNTMDSKNHRLSTKNTFFKSGVLNNAGRQIGVKKLNRTTTSGETPYGTISMISSVTKNFGGIHPKRSHVVNENKSEIIVISDDDEDPNHDGKFSSHFVSTNTSSDVEGVRRDFARYEPNINTLVRKMSKLHLDENQDSNSTFHEQEYSAHRRAPLVVHDPLDVFCLCVPCAKWHRETLDKLDELTRELSQFV